MELDNPETPEFASWRSYENFARAVRQDHAYGASPAARAFIATVLATCVPRDMVVTQGTILFRAQLDIDEYTYEDEEGVERIEISGHGRERMMPRADKATGGRANPAGVALLYMASELDTAISEMRPWFGASISVAQFRIKRKLKVLNLTDGHGRFGLEKLTFPELFGKRDVSAEKKQEVVWTEIDSAFSRPVSRAEENNDYLPTQVLALAFREHGYDGIVYRSNFGEPGYNIVLFNPDDAEIRNCSPYRVKKIIIKAEQQGNTWYVADEAKSAKTKETEGKES